MRKIIKNAAATTAACILAAAGAVIAAGAAEQEPLKIWTFDDGDLDSWAVSGWSTGGIDSSVAASEDKLKFNTDYSSLADTVTWRTANIQRSYYGGDPEDFSNAEQITFDLWIPAEEAGNFSQVSVTFQGSADDGGFPSATDRISLSGQDTQTETIGSQSYTKYQVTMELGDDMLSYKDSNQTDQTIAEDAMREKTRLVILGLVGKSDCSFNGSVYVDNIAIYGGEDMPEITEIGLDKTLAVYNESISAEGGQASSSYQWYRSSTYSGEGETISGAVSSSYTPVLEDVGGWLYCEATGTDGSSAVSSRVRVAASAKDTMEIEYPHEDKIGNYHLALISNTSTNSGKVDVSKWAAGGYVEIRFSGISYDTDHLPMLNLGTWSAEGKTSQNVTAYDSGSEADGIMWARFRYEDMVAAWYDDPEFTDMKALRVYYNSADEANLQILGAGYTGPALSYGDTLEQVSMRGTSPTNQYLFTAHVGGSEFDATRIREDSYFYVEYTGTEDAVQLVAQSHSDGDSSGSTYATVDASEHGKTGAGYYSKFTAEDIKAKFGNRFRMIDGIRLNQKSGGTIQSTPSLYFYEGEGQLVDDIRADGYERAVDVPWTKYDDTDKDGIVVIGASISQNPLVTPAAMSGHPFYAAQGGWNAMLDRTDVVTYGIGSQTTTDIAARFHEIMKYDYKQIIIQCGNNDLGGFTGDDAPERAAEHEFNNYCIMMDQVEAKNEQLRAEGKPEIPVYILAINNVNSKTTNEKIAAVIEKLQELEEKYSFVTYIEEINAEFLDEATGYSKPELVMSDGLHPVAEGYAIYARYLKPLLASKDGDDASLVSLSWRADDTSRKYTVDGFESGDSGEKEYNVSLAAGAPETVRLYITPNNLNASVEVSEGTITADDYGNNYINVDMSAGSRTVEIRVTSEDGSQTSTFKVNLTAKDKSVLFSAEDAQFDLNDDFAREQYFPYVQYAAEVAGAGMVLSFDVEVENLDFDQIWVKGSYSWDDPDQGIWLQAEDFDNYVYHIERTLDQDSISNVIISLGGGNTDYRGSVLIKNIEVKKAGQTQ